MLSYLALIKWLVMNKWYSIFYCHCNMVICPCKHIIIYDITEKKKRVLSSWLNGEINHIKNNYYVKQYPGLWHHLPSCRTQE
jgi:hypothetical protein